jgi:CheY-like chemotaxis protein
MAMKPMTRELKLLVVDDHEASLLCTVNALSLAGVMVEQALTGTEAVLIAGHLFPDLIFMDICLPDMSGLDAARQIRDDWPQSLPDPEFVILSGNDPQEYQESLQDLAIAHAYRKPISRRDLRQIVQLQDYWPGSPVKPHMKPPKLTVLFRNELQQRLPMLETHLSNNDIGSAAGLVHQLVASSAMTGESRLESCFLLLNQLLGIKSAPSELAGAYYKILEAANDYLSRTR